MEWRRGEFVWTLAYLVNSFRDSPMPLKEWIIHLPDGFVLLIRRDTSSGHCLDFAVVLVFNDECVTRYDCAHGFPHRDVLGRKSGLIRKEICSNMSMNEAFQHAIQDLSSNYRAYYDFYARQ
jgi:hypothetical protein